MFWRARTNANYIEPPTQRPTEDTLKQMFTTDSRAVFENADRMTLYSIDPSGISHEELGTSLYKKSGRNMFYAYPIKGVVKVTNRKERAALIAQLYNGIARAREEDQASCFSPRHAIRATKEKKAVDLLICFSCSNLQVHYGKTTSYAAVTKQPQKFYDSVLTKAGVPLAP